MDIKKLKQLKPLPKDPLFPAEEGDDYISREEQLELNKLVSLDT